MQQRLWPHQTAPATAWAMAVLYRDARTPRATETEVNAARLAVALWFALDRIGGADAHTRHWLTTGDLDRPACILADYPTDEHDRQALHDLRALADTAPRHRARAIALLARALDSTPDRSCP